MNQFFVILLAASSMLVGCSHQVVPNRAPKGLPSWSLKTASNVSRPLPSIEMQMEEARTNSIRMAGASSGLPSWGKALGQPAVYSPAPAAAPAPAAGPAPIIIHTGSAAAPDPGPLVSAPAPLSRIESLYNRVPTLSKQRGLQQFGYNAIRPSGTDELDAQVPGSYRVGPGDQLKLRSIGGLVLDQSYTVDRDGRIFLPKVGAIPVAGKALSDLQDYLSMELSDSYREFTLTVSLDKLRLIRLYVTGLVNQPGPLTVPANASMLDILGAAGGVTKDGSLRRLRWQHDEGTELIDLYGLLLSGEGDALPQVQDNARLHVPAIGATAAIIGPGGDGIFELAQKDSLDDLVRYAGATNAFTGSDGYRLERAGDDGLRSLKSLSPDALASTACVDADVLALPESLSLTANPVSLEGAVLQAGTYAHEPGMRVLDLIRLGEGFQLDASLERALLHRRFGPTTRYDLAPGDAASSTSEQIIWIDLEKVLDEDESANLELLPHDSLRIQTVGDVEDGLLVKIAGAVRKPGDYRLTSGLSLGDLISLAGGPTARAYRGNSTLVRQSLSEDELRVDVSNYSFSLSEVLKGSAAASLPLQNHDEIIIRAIQPSQVTATIDGRVQFPGTYTLSQGARITDLIAEAGGLLADADLRAASFTRDRIRQQQQQRIADLHTRTEERFTRTRDLNTRDGSAGESLAGQLGLVGLDQATSNMNRLQASGRIVLDFMDPAFPMSLQNLRLEKGDRLTVPRSLDTVAVLGRVFSPNAFLWQPTMSVKEYVDLAGGTLDDADHKQAYVILASGQVVSAAQDRGVRGLERYKPSAGDTILIPAKPLERSTLSKLGSGINVVRDLAELGLIGTAIPASGGTATSIPLDIGARRSTPADVAPNIPVEQLLQR